MKNGSASFSSLSRTLVPALDDKVIPHSAILSFVWLIRLNCKSGGGKEGSLFTAKDADLNFGLQLDIQLSSTSSKIRSTSYYCPGVA